MIDENPHASLQSQIEFALEATDSVVWTINLSTGEIETGFGPIASLFDVEGSAIEDRQSFFETTVHPEDLPTLRRQFEEIMYEKTDQIQAEFRTHPDRGEVRWIESYGRVFTTDDGTRVLTGIATDITDRKRREQELAEANERLEEFASVLSHDLRNPLSVASGQLEHAREDNPDSDRIETALQALERMDTLINDLQTSIREGGPLMRGGFGTEEMDTVALASVAESAWQNVSNRRATLDVNTDRVVQADHSHLQQLFENLFRNAIDHGGDDITITVDDLDRNAGFYVADDGPGFADIDTDRVFEAGYSDADGGTGMGLHIVQEVANAHGWQVTATESEDGGARLEITSVETAAE